MSKPDSSGPAFPQPLAARDDGKLVSSLDCKEGGMTLRDYIAAKALAGLLPDSMTYSKELQRQRSEVALERFMAGLAYAYADAMLQAREA